MEEHRNYKRRKLDELFYSEDTEAPFSNCSLCDKYLLEEGVRYMIEKAVKYNKHYNVKETIFEHAICTDCAEKMRENLSKESLKSIEQYFMQNMQQQQRYDLMTSENTETNDWLSNCLLSGEEIGEQEEYQIYAECDGSDMLFEMTPYMISGKVLESVSELLSKQTKDELDRYMDEHFGVPPELRELFRDKVLIF
ncbi:MAG: hypothetical protein GY810_08270 [Aureispira sp.]|nr:hypothetical protein [Aureispira sp.]